MSGFLSKFFQRLIHIQITEMIDVKQANRIYSHLESSYKYSVPGIIVSINSKGGCLTQAKNIAAAIKQFSERKVAPIYCFAEDMCLNSANVLLTAGKNSYASRLSLMGDFGYYSSTLGLKEFLKEQKIRAEVMRAGVNKARMNPFEDLSEADRKWMQNYVYALEHELRLSIIKNRHAQFKRLDLTKQQIEKDIFEKGILQPEEAVKLGLIDGIKTVDELIEQKFSGVKVVKINPPKYSWARMFDIKNIMEDL